MSRSKIFKGRPDRLLIDQRAILIKLPDFSDAPPLEDESDPDDFLINEDFIIEEEEELEAAPLRVFIGTANISKIEEDNSLVESGAMVWDLSAMVESPEEDEFEIFDSFDDGPNVASIQIGGGQPVVQTAVTPAASAWALDEADEELDLSDQPSETSVDISVGRIKLPLAIPEEPPDLSGLTSKSEENPAIVLEEDSDEDWGIFNNDQSKNVSINIAEPSGETNSVSEMSSKEDPVEVKPESLKKSQDNAVKTLASNKTSASYLFMEPDNVEVTDKDIVISDDLHDPPEPISLKQGTSSHTVLLKGVQETGVSSNSSDAQIPHVVPVEETDEQIVDKDPFNFDDTFDDHLMVTDNHSGWIVIILLLVAVIVVLLLTTS